MTNNYNWPDPARPGVPMNPEKDSDGHVLRVNGEVDVYRWIAANNWYEDRKRYWVHPDFLVYAGDSSYLGRILTPAEVEARVAKARRAGLEEAAERAKALTHSWRNQEQRGGVAYGEAIIAAIRALMEKKDE